jgi:hypothetical protein
MKRRKWKPEQKALIVLEGLTVSARLRGSPRGQPRQILGQALSA